MTWSLIWGFYPKWLFSNRKVLSDVAISNGKHPGCLSPLGSEFVNVNVAGQAVLARLKVLDLFYCGWGIVGEGEH